MREFLKNQLKNLHISTGLQQYYKLQELADGKEQTKLLIDELTLVCTWFPLIPEKEKERIITEGILTDPEFIGFNKKIILKWLNAQNHKYFPDQSKYTPSIDESKIASPDVADYWLKKWNEEVAKVGNVQPRADGIKDWRIQQLKDGFSKLECKHPTWIYSGENEERCNDCGITRLTTERADTKT